MSDITFGRDHLGPWVEYEGRRTWCNLESVSPEQLRETAARDEERGYEALYRARRARAAADAIEARRLAQADAQRAATAAKRARTLANRPSWAR